MEPLGHFLSRRDVLTTGLACSCSALLYAQEAKADESPRDVLLDRPAKGMPHKGKMPPVSVLLAPSATTCSGTSATTPRLPASSA